MVLGLALFGIPVRAQDTSMAGMHMAMPMGDGHGHRMPPMPAGMLMMPGLDSVSPQVTAFLPSGSATPAVPGTVVEVKDGDTLTLDARLVTRTINGATYTTYAYNGQIPGPLIRVKQNTTFVVRFTNHINLPSSIHWHGVRLDNQFDGIDAVGPGASFIYKVHVPDAGLFWYHPHIREDIEQGLGLFGNLRVDSPDPAYYNPVNAEATLILDDLLVDKTGLIPYGKEGANFAIMGRFGNVLLVNGQPRYHLDVHRGDVVRFFLTNASNARSYNIDFAGAKLKLVATDESRYEREMPVTSVVIAPAQRFIVEGRYDSAGTFPIANRVQAVSNFAAEYSVEADTLGTVTVSPERTTADHAKEFTALRSVTDVSKDIDRFRSQFDRPPDHTLILTVNIQGLPRSLVQFMAIDTMYFNPVEWNDGMPDMNWLSTSKEVHWIMRDSATGKENMDIDWPHMRAGQMITIRIHNDERSMHPMAHPIHFHGQRFLVIDRDGVRNTNLAWQDTELVPVGTTEDLLLDASNPGVWMAHCHIAEHLDAGMMMRFTVDP
ncbi:MAG TPA: multicopper oxidase domain-containing protein [Gemmatimonadaceae bacterium]|nr:multicopper oxidase domain-containing protein [Gemmatimonadaceae bacterium]